MSRHAVHLFCYRLTVDATHRERACNDLAGCLQGFDLTNAESRMISEGDVAGLFMAGTHPLLLVRLALYQVAGLDETKYSERMRQLRH